MTAVDYSAASKAIAQSLNAAIKEAGDLAAELDDIGDHLDDVLDGLRRMSPAEDMR